MGFYFGFNCFLLASWAGVLGYVSKISMINNDKNEKYLSCCIMFPFKLVFSIYYDCFFNLKL